MAGRKASADWRLTEQEIAALVDGTHGDPFARLGLHQVDGTWLARAVVPGADRVRVATLDGRQAGELARRGDTRFFEGPVTVGGRTALRYLAANDRAEWSFVDPYSFGPVLGPMDDYYSAEGTHLRLFDRLGAHPVTHEGIAGVEFAVWAPNARRVSVVGDFNGWDGRRHVMRHRQSGVWEIFVPELGPGTIYKYEILGADGRLTPLKADPFAFASEMRPKTASVVAAPPTHRWGDEAWRKARSLSDPRRVPMSIYEVHAGSWKRRRGGGFLSWEELAAELVPYAVDLGFTHLELMPINEHPLDASWGYQPTGLFAPTSRFGAPDGFERFVDAAHQAGIGIILDWVPAHFPTDPHGLSRFDGTALYEHEDPRQGFHPDWNTAIYNFGRKEVAAFLINSALFWLERFHVDGLRVDAVASMLYLDYSRQAGQWLPNEKGGNENLQAVEFLRRMNVAAYGQNSGIVTVAEESTSWPGVSKPTNSGGLGFGFKWNMGFMNDTLRYLQRASVHRRHHHDDVTFGLLYAFAENFILPLSHDEVVHGKGTLLRKMAGDDWQKFATLRAYYAFMWGYPGKKLLFMGQEFASWDEWSEARGLDWHLTGYAPHAGTQKLIRDLNKLYRSEPALHARDGEGEGFEWLVVDDSANSVFAWARYSGGADPPVAVITNFTPVPRTGYAVRLPRDGTWRERINTDSRDYGGSGMGNFGTVTAEHGSARVTLPPLATLILSHGG
ncbi:1,4-alpha-glucan branching protein GlgB [soil metagenome]